MDIEKYKIKSVCKLKKGLIMSGNSVSNVSVIDSQGVKSEMSVEYAKRLEKQNILIFDANTNTYKVNTDTKGIKLQRENENRIFRQNT